MGFLERRVRDDGSRRLEGSARAAPARSGFDCDARPGVSIAIPPWRCSVLYQGKNVRQTIAAVIVVEAAEAGVVLQGLGTGHSETGVVVGHGGIGSVNGSRRGRRAVVRCTCSSSNAPRSECRVSTCGLDALFVASLFDETTVSAERSPGLRGIQHNRVAAEDPRADVEVEVRPLVSAHNSLSDCLRTMSGSAPWLTNSGLVYWGCSR